MAVLVPTTLLATQHFQTFSERFAAFPVRVEVLSRFLTSAQAKAVAEGVRAGEVDCVIGTHRLLSDDIEFKDLGLLVVDEEQRFGVTHKERIKKMRTQVDVLTLSATPIPRTLQLAIGGLRDLSLITTAPADRRAVRTYACRWDDHTLKEAIERELRRGGQRVAQVGPGAGVMGKPLGHAVRVVRGLVKVLEFGADEAHEHLRVHVGRGLGENTHHQGAGLLQAALFHQGVGLTQMRGVRAQPMLPEPAGTRTLVPLPPSSRST